MGRRARVFAVVAAIAIALLVADLVAETLALGRLRALVEAELSEATGLEGRVYGDFFLSLLPNPGFEATELVVANLPGRASPRALEIGRFALDLRLLPLLRGVIEFDAVEISDAVVHLETDAEGRFRVSHDLDSLAEDEPESEPVDFRIRSIQIENTQLFYLDGRTGAVTSLQLDRLSLETEGMDGEIFLEAEGQADGSPFAIEGRFGSLAELLRPSEAFPVWLRGRLFEAEIEAEGSVQDPMELRGLDLAVRADLPELAALLDDSAAKRAAGGPVEVAARVRTDASRSVSIEDLRIATTQGASLRAELTGSIRDLAALRGVALELEVKTDDLDFLEPLLEEPLPEIDDATLSALISDRDGSIGIEGSLRVVALEGGVELELSGEHDDLRQLDEIDVGFQIRARDLAHLGELLDLEPALPAIGPVTAQGRLRDREGAVGIHGLAVRVGARPDTWLEVTGSVGDVIELRNLELTASFGARDLEYARPYLGADLPDIGSIRGGARLSDLDGTLGIEELVVHGGLEGTLTIDLSGAFDDLRDIDEIAFGVDLRARDLSVIGKFFDADLPGIGPVEFSGRAAGSDERISAEGVRVRLGQTHLRGDFSGSFAPQTRPSLKARIESAHVRLADIGIEPESELAAAAAQRRAAQAEDGPGLSGEDPLPFEELRKLDLDLALRVQRITGREGLDVRDARLELQLKDGDLRIRELSGVYNRGRVHGELRVDARRPEPLLLLKSDVEGMSLAAVMSQLEDDTNHSGWIDAAIDLRSRGDNLDAIGSNLGGRVHLQLRDGAAASPYARAFAVDFFRAVVPRRPFKQVESVSCVVGMFQLEDGVAEVETLLLASDDVIVVGTGEVDIGGRSFDLLLTPKVRDPSLLSMAATVEVTGPLADPVIRPRGRSLARSAARGLLGNLLRPDRAALRGFRDHSQAARKACGDAIVRDAPVPQAADTDTRS